VLAARQGGEAIRVAEARLAYAGRADGGQGGAAVRAAAKQRVQLRHPAGHRLHREVAAVVSGHEARPDDQAALRDDVVVVPAVKRDTTELEDLEPAALAAVLGRRPLQLDHAVADRLELAVGVTAAARDGLVEEV